MMAITPSLNASSLAVVIPYTVPGNQPAWPQLRMRFETALCRRPTILRMEILHTAVSIPINPYISGTLFAVFQNPTFLIRQEGGGGHEDCFPSNLLSTDQWT